MKMVQNIQKPALRKGRSLSFLISLCLFLATIIPLLIILGYIWLATRPLLINQAKNVMTSDAQTRVQIIDTYFHERLLDAKTLTQVTVVQQFLARPLSDSNTPDYQVDQVHALYALQAGLNRNPDYTNWALFDAQGQLRLALPNSKKLPKRGANYYTAQQLASVKAGKEFISPVFYDATTHTTSVDIFAPVVAINAQGQPMGVLGFMRATLNLTTVNTLIHQDSNVHGAGSYAFIVDDQGVRIADPDTQRMFTSVAILSAPIQRQITAGQRYTTQQDVSLLAAPTIATARQQTTASESIQGNLDTTNTNYQIVRQAATEVPWQYFVVSPVNSVTATANTQIQDIIILMIIASVLVAIIGIITGHSITRPILQAVEQLQNNSQALSSLSSNQQEAANEQVWVVESSQVGMQSVQYYSDASRTAAQRLRDTAQELRAALPSSLPPQIEQLINNIFDAANYIERATELQGKSGQKLAAALKVATQVTEQLHNGATSTAEAATHLEEVVEELHAVVGRS
ncbi:cache domain-containing protein [Ktedonobacteria bacterium brp13]|nr:cache domain-containing protein [Ktedonobacteria bacterium brp13]